MTTYIEGAEFLDNPSSVNELKNIVTDAAEKILRSDTLKPWHASADENAAKWMLFDYLLASQIEDDDVKLVIATLIYGAVNPPATVAA